MPKFIALVFATLLVLTACGGETSKSTSKEPAASEPAATKSSKPKPKMIDAESVRKTLIEDNGLKSIEDLCDSNFTHWACFFDKVVPISSEGIRVELTTDGGRSDSELSAMADKAGRDWLQLTCLSRKDLQTVVVYVNGRDRNTTNRRDLTLCQ